MEALFEIKGFAFSVEFFLKSSLILAAALGLSFLFRKQSASVRHFLLGLSLLGILFLPFISVFIPGWKTDFLPALKTGTVNHGIIEDWNAMEKSKIHPNENGLDRSSLYANPVNQTHIQANGSPGENANFNGTLFLGPLYRYGFIALWCLVSGFMLVKILFGLYGAFRLTHQGIFMKGYPWQHLFQLFLRRISLKRNVRLVKNKQVTIPMTWGVLNPVVLMPPGSSKWPVEQCSSVLFHELSHIKRGDFLVGLLSRISCSFYWFNPLSWIVLRRLQKEQEKACDEMVLKAGIRPSTYAASLLRMKKTIDKGHHVPSTAMAMTGISELNERLTTILAKKLKPKEIKMKTKIILSILVFFAVTLIGTAKPDQAAPDTKDKTEVTSKKTKEKKKECEEKKIDLWITKDDTTNGKEGKVKKIIICSGDSKVIGTKELKLDGDFLIIKEPGKKIKKIHCHSKKGKEAIQECLKDKDIHIEVKGDKVIISTGKGKDKEYTGWVETEKGKEGKCNKYVFIEKKKGKKEEDSEVLVISEKKYGKVGEIVTISMGKEGDVDVDVKVDVKSMVRKHIREACHVFLISRDGKDKKGLKMIVFSENKVGKDVLQKIEKAVAKLRKNLPESYKVESEVSETLQKITIDYPSEKLDIKTRKEAQKHIEEFEKAFKKMFPSSKDKKPLKKKIIIKEKENEA